MNLALITGGNRGIGFELVKQLAEKDLTVIFTSRNPHDGQRVLTKLPPLAKNLVYHPLDISDNSSVATLEKFVTAKFGYLDLLINNAATNYDTWQTASQVTMTEVEYTFSVNLLGPWRMCNAFIPLLKKRDSHIVNISSGAGAIANLDGKIPAYSLSKNSLNMFTKSLATDLQKTSIRVNAICPGWVRTKMGGLLAPVSAKEAAKNIIHTAMSKKTGNGKFYRNRKEIAW